MRCSRRRWIASGVGLAVCGCLGRPSAVAREETPNPSPTPTTVPDVPGDLRLVDGTPTVRFPALADGEVSVSNELVVTYAPPVDATFGVAAILDGTEIEDEATSDSLRVNTSIPAGGPPTVYPAPVYREGAGFEYRIYANDAFVDMHDWHVSAGTGDSLDEDGVGSRAARFEPHYEHVHRDVVTAGLVPGGDATDPLSVAVVQYPFERIRAEEPDDVTGVVLAVRRGGQSTPARAPEVSFSFEQDGSTGVLTHVGGDSIDAESLVVRIDGVPTDVQWADEHDPVTTGDSLRIDLGDASEGAMLRVVWTRDDGGAETVLAVFRIR